VQAQRSDLVILDRSMHSRHKIALVELTCPWDTDAKRAGERMTARYADLKEKLSNQGWDCSLYLIEVGARGDNVMSVKDCFRSLLWAWVPAGHRSGIGQMMKDAAGFLWCVRLPYFRLAMTLSCFLHILSCDV
jgi:hypothetical protein